MKTNQGFIGRIILLIVAVVALKYFLDFDLIAWLRSPDVQSAVQPIVSFVMSIYDWLDQVVRALVGR
ncbi:MAG TPA: hypothetical protein VJG67_01885 [Candidatus Paceibacterota bacterium]